MADTEVGKASGAAKKAAGNGAGVTPANTRTLNVSVPTDMHEQLVKRAETEERTMATVVVRALRKYLSSQDGIEGQTPAAAAPAAASPSA